MLRLMSDSLEYIQKISKIFDKTGYTFIIQVYFSFVQVFLHIDIIM